MPRAASPARPRPQKRGRRRRWIRRLFLLAALAALALSGVLGYFYVQFSRMLDERLHGEVTQAEPRVFARPFELRAGQAMTEQELVERLNDLGYAVRDRVEGPGEFAVGPRAIAMIARGGKWDGRRVEIVFSTNVARAGAKAAPPRMESLSVAGAGRVESVVLDPPLLSALVSTGRERRRRVPLDRIPKAMREAVLAIEDRRFYDHPGVDVVRTIGAILTNLRGDRPYLVGGSTLTQQLVKNSFLTREKTIRRKLQEQFIAVLLERRLSKDEILGLYLNEVYLGQRGSFAIHGVAEAARLFFGKDVANLTLAEAATVAGVIQSPPGYSPFRNPDRARDRRNVVLRAMADTGFVTPEAAAQAAAEPLSTVARALDAEAPYFVDVIGQTFAEAYPGLAQRGGTVDIYSTLDQHLQRLGQDAVRSGLQRVDEMLAKKQVTARPQAALVAVDPRTGEVLAFVGGRTYSQSQFNRVTSARRQPGSVFKPFVYLAAFEEAAATGRTDLTPATVVDDSPTTFSFGEEEWTPGNYGDEYDGLITLRRALAMSRNVATAKVAEMTGYGKVAALWKRIGAGTQPRAYPSIALGVFEATPWEIAQAYTVFPNLGEVRPLQTLTRVVSGGEAYGPPAVGAPRRVARQDTTFLVMDMMRSVVNEGTGAGARAAGFALDAAGKSGTTNDLRDAWFVGFTPELLTVVWVGFDDNREVGLSGSQAALPIWAGFMQRALAGHANGWYTPPENVSFVEIDRDTGEVAGPGCPRVFNEAFLRGSEPTTVCALHNY
jgi:penicillin-binding protein 1B